MSDVRLNRFEVSILGNNNQFYANGRQQIRVEIEILKEKWDGTSGTWSPEPLTTSERASLTLVDFSSSMDQTNLPLGWFVDTERNGFFTGPYFASQAEPKPEAGAEAKATQAPPGEPGDAIKTNAIAVPETHSRFVRSTFVGPEKLMARVRLDDGLVLTTNMSSGDHNFTSNVVLYAVTPHFIQPSQVTMTTQTLLNYTTSSNGEGQVVTGYFWMMPLGLAIDSITHVGEPRIFFFRNEQSWIMRGRSYPSNVSLYVLTTEHFPPASQIIQGWNYRVDIAKNQFAVDVLTIKPCYVNSYWHSTGAVFAVVDMYGNEHRYRVDPSSDFSTMTLSTAPSSAELPQGAPANAEPARAGGE